MKAPNIKMGNVRQTEKMKQNKYKFYADKRRNVKNIYLHVGDWVRIRKSGHVLKGEQRFSSPIQIIKKISAYTFEMSDGRRWNVSKLMKCNPPEVYKSFSDTLQESSASVLNDRSDLGRGKRIRSRPKWHKDYVMY